MCCGVGQLAIWWRHSSAIIPGGAIGLINDGLSCDMMRPLPDMLILLWGMCQLPIWWRLSSFDVLERTVWGSLFHFDELSFCGNIAYVKVLRIILFILGLELFWPWCDLIMGSWELPFLVPLYLVLFVEYVC